MTLRKTACTFLKVLCGQMPVERTPQIGSGMSQWTHLSPSVWCCCIHLARRSRWWLGGIGGHRWYCIGDYRGCLGKAIDENATVAWARPVFCGNGMFGLCDTWKNYQYTYLQKAYTQGPRCEDRCTSYVRFGHRFFEDGYQFLTAMNKWYVPSKMSIFWGFSTRSSLWIRDFLKDQCRRWLPVLDPRRIYYNISKIFH